MYIELPTARIFFDVIGHKLDPENPADDTRPTLLMLHGGPGYDHMTLRPYYDRYADVAQIVYYDHRACGRSGGALETANLDQWADDVADLCAALGIKAPILFGQSVGGMVAMRAAIRHPDLASKLILSSTAAHFELDVTMSMARRLGGDPAAEAARNLFTNPTLETYNEFARICLPLYTRTTARKGTSFRHRTIEKPAVTIKFFRDEMMDMDMRPQLSAISIPTLVLAGARDPVTPSVCSEDIAMSIGSNAQLIVFEDSGHGPYRDDPEGIEAVTRAFVASR